MGKLPRLHGGAMWRQVSWILCVFVSSQIPLWSVCAAAEEQDEEVKIEVLFKPEPCSPRSKKGDLMNVHYDGYLAKDGSQFYCSRSDKAGHPQWFVLGVGQILKGLDIGMEDMCAGEKRKITVPPALAFGEKGKHPVPPNATVIFEVEVYMVSRGPRSMEAFGEMDQDKDKSLTKDEVKQHLKMQYERDGKTYDEPFYEKIMADIFYKNDQDRDGQISMKEYNVFKHDEL
ncbi:peptidyl-prolyl cis-trans isomerase FKBP7 [Cheilinus undulatus]|uniref:peptidyl-prolyl cis-trans isomerase FKBP7 n=1 Tax=Cheilinus undulatus TaxID=241271 RepID=UPI001BD4CE59|nr:peptidyl-prolyl cis-trans isomerase FKBP7 [Cheilinus undulatus]